MEKENDVIFKSRSDAEELDDYSFSSFSVMPDQNSHYGHQSKEQGTASNSVNRNGEQKNTTQFETKKVQAREVLVDGYVYKVAEGDLLLDEDEYSIWHEETFKNFFENGQLTHGKSNLEEISLNDDKSQESALIGIKENGQIVKWASGEVLTYSVLMHTFPRLEWYEEAVENMRAATQDWEDVCGIQFEYKPQYDNSPSTRPPGITFPVRYISANGAFIAAAFFPNDPKNRQRLLLDASYFYTDFDRIGVLRHETGHIIGCRHEHTSPDAPPVCPDEDLTNTIELTKYDPKSVMHYFCGGVGSRNLELTEIDVQGIQKLYGPPRER